MLSTLCFALAIAGCEATGESGGDRTVSADGVPFTFRVPAEFTTETIDEANSRGDVLVAAGVSKVDVIAVRRAGDVVVVGGGPVRHEVLGHDVVSELHPVEGVRGYAIECQYTSDRADKVREACREALRTVQRR